MAKIGQYNWSPRQMERINARREARGRESLVNLKNIKTEEDLQKAQNLVASSKDTRKPVKPVNPELDEENKSSMLEEAKRRTEAFRAKFKPEGSMAAEYGVKSSLPSALKNGFSKGVSIPTTKFAMDRIIGSV
jgi:hypothetical protein